MGFELDEYIFEKATKYFKHRKYNNAEVLNRQVNLVDIKQRLTFCARALSGRAIEIFPAEREGGYKNKNFFLTISCALFATKEENLQYYFYRVVYLCVQQSLDLNWTESGQTELLSSEKAIATAPQVLTKLFADYPSLHLFYENAVPQIPLHPKTKTPDVSWLYGKWMLNTIETEVADSLHNFNDQIKKANNVVAKTTLQAKAVEEINSLGYGFDYEYVSYSNNTIVIPDMTLDDKDKFICFLNEREISWSNN